MLNTYLQKTQLLLGDAKQEKYNLFDLVSYINTARFQIAAQGQCVRFLAGGGGDPPVASITVTAPGSGYTNPQVFIIPLGVNYTIINNPGVTWTNNSSAVVVWKNSSSNTVVWGISTLTVTWTDPPGITDATALANLFGGTISGINITSPGNGYSQPPQVVIVDPSGSGAKAVATLVSSSGSGGSGTGSGGFLTTVAGQEVYKFKNIATDPSNGIGQVFSVKTIAMLWGTWRYVTAVPSFSRYQAIIRTYSNQYLDIPYWFAQYGQGTNGSVYMYPIPSAVYQMEWDCLCLPIVINKDSDPEAVPYMWTEAVPYYAAYLGFLSSGDFDKAEYMIRKYDEWMHRARAYFQSGRSINFYGRG